MDDYFAGSSIHTSNAPRMQLVDECITFIREVNELLQKESDLSPANPLVAKSISRLSLQMRSHYLQDEVQAVLNDEYIQKNLSILHNNLSQSEFLVELNDSRHICQTENVDMDIVTRLPSWSIYMSLVSQELFALSRLIKQQRHAEQSPIVFVGSGPMPLSSMLLHLLGDVKVICLEIDVVAYEASCLLLQHLGLQSKVEVILRNGSEFDYSSYSRIFVASLVRNKRAVLEQISRTSPDCVVAVRTAEGMRQIMYEAIDELQLNKQGWRILGRTSPEYNLVMNTTLFLEYVTAPAQLD